MNIKEIRAKLNEIAVDSDDSHQAHYLQDLLYVDVIRSIADGSCDNPAACAVEVLKVQEIEFPRWYS